MEPKRRSGGRQDYQTPPEFISATDEVFDLDLAASPENAQAPRFYSHADDGLVQPWDGQCMWLNPPFGATRQWLKRAAGELEALRASGRRLYVLVPAAVGANWFRDYVWGKAQVRLLSGRITFVGMAHGFDRDCMMLVYGPPAEQADVCIWRWAEGKLTDPIMAPCRLVAS